MCKVKVFAFMLVYSSFFPLNLLCNMTRFRFFLPDSPTHELRMCVRAYYVLAWASMLHIPFIDMQHDFFQKKVFTFDLNPGIEGVCKERLCACI